MKITEVTIPYLQAFLQGRPVHGARVGQGQGGRGDRRQFGNRTRDGQRAEPEEGQGGRGRGFCYEVANPLVVEPSVR